MNEFNPIVIPHLQKLFQEAYRQIRPYAEPTSWSCVYRLDLVDGTHLFVKGTPRTRAEALVTQRLGSRCPPFAPHVLIPDLLPTTSWRWFVLEDAGESQKGALTLSQACTVARALGTLQCCTENDPVLPNLLTDCSAYQLYQRLLAVCFWAMQAERTLHWRDELHHLTNCLERAQPFLANLPLHWLRCLPPLFMVTCGLAIWFSQRQAPVSLIGEMPSGELEVSLLPICCSPVRSLSTTAHYCGTPISRDVVSSSVKPIVTPALSPSTLLIWW